jgi:hypothetical protein
MGRSSEMMNSKFSGESLRDVTLRLNQTVDKINNIKSSVIEPLRKSLLELARSRGSKTGTLERNITINTERLKGLKASINSSQESIRITNQRLVSMVQQFNRIGANYTVAVNSAFLGLPLDENDSGPGHPRFNLSQADLTMPSSDLNEYFSSSTSSSTSSSLSMPPSSDPLASAATIGQLRVALDSSDFRRRYDVCVADLAGVTVRLAAAKKSLNNLEVNDGPTNTSTSTVSSSFKSITDTGSNDNNSSSSSAAPCSAHRAEECPTCGQELSSDALAKRITEVSSSVFSLQRELRAAQDRIDDAKRRLDLSLRAEALLIESNTTFGRCNECLSQIEKYETLVSEISSNEKAYQNEIAEWSNAKKKIEEEDNLMESKTNASAELAEKQLQDLNALEQKLRVDVEEVGTTGHLYIMSYILSMYSLFVCSPLHLIISLIVYYVPNFYFPLNSTTSSFESSLYLHLLSCEVFFYFYITTLRHHLFFLYSCSHSLLLPSLLPLPSFLLSFFPSSLLAPTYVSSGLWSHRP